MEDRRGGRFAKTPGGGCGASVDPRRIDGQDNLRLTERRHYYLSKTVTVNDLKAVPEGALIEYRCDEDDIVWYEPVAQVLEGAPLRPKDPCGPHWCPYCDGPVWPSGYLGNGVS